MARKKGGPFFKLLREQKKKGKPVSIYTRPEDPLAMDVGTVLGVTNRHVLVTDVSPEGYYRGYVCYELEDIHRVDTAGRYEKSRMKLNALRRQCHPKIEIQGKSLPRGLLKYAKKKKLIVSVAQFGEGEKLITGFVKGVKKGGDLTLRLIDAYGEKCGKAVCPLDSVTRVYCDGQGENDRLLLYLSKKGWEDEEHAEPDDALMEGMRG